MQETPAYRRTCYGLAFGLAVLSFALDQWSKWALLEHMRGAQYPFIEITSFFDVVLVWNTGISFGMFSGGNQPLIFTAISSVVIVILLGWLAKNPSKLMACAIGSIVGGAIGNVIDRLRFGAVTDFLDFHIGNYHWPAFNIADACIFIGVVLLCAGSMVSERIEPKG